MTLILAAHCKEGVCICSDRRNTIRYTHKPTEFSDTLKKVYSFQDLPIAIYNHGVNHFSGVAWSELCRSFENKCCELKDQSFKEIAKSFAEFVHPAITKELERNRIDTLASFVICGKSRKDQKYRIVEYAWSKENDLPPADIPQGWFLGGLICSGSGASYTKCLVERTKADTDAFWENKTICQTRECLVDIFEESVKLRSFIRLSLRDKSDLFTPEKGMEFSDTYDITIVQ